MKKLLIIFLTFMFIPAFAIDWLSVESKLGNTIEIDKDSITEYNNYYFYNVKINTNGTDDIVVTMQAQKSTPFCARIKKYNLSEYGKLKGDYANITKEMTQSLEPITYESRAYAAYKAVKKIIITKNKPQITF